jgi:DNA-binding MarR family transcriptional regulator
MTHPRSQLDELLLHPVRFSILALLHHVADAEFAYVRDEIEVSDSLLSKQASTLEAADYLAIDKTFVGKRPNTRLRLTPQGRAAFAAHLKALQSIVDGETADTTKTPTVPERNRS